MIIFVTGVTGFIGREFLDALLRQAAENDTVRVLARADYSSPDPRVEVVHGDLREPESWVLALDGVAWVFHLAGDARFGNGRDYHELNVAPVQAMLDALRGSPHLCRFVFVSTIGAVDREPADRCGAPLTVESPSSPSSDYGRSKYEAEQRVRSSGLPYTVIRPGWVYGCGMRPQSHLSVLAKVVARHGWFAGLAFPGRVPLIHVRDLADALVRCMERQESVNMTYFAITENRTVGEITRVFHERLHGGPLQRVQLGGLRGFVRRWHSWLPFTVKVLFSDFLAAADPAFAATLGPQAPVLFEEGSKDVTSRIHGVRGWWIVTGANSGIGRAITMVLARRGVPVIAVDRCVDMLEETSEVRVILADLADPLGIAAVVAAASAVNVTGLVNNAGVGFRGDFTSRSLDDAMLTIAVNDLAPIRLTHQLLPLMRRTAATVVNICSSVAYYPLPGMATYAASKALLLNWSLALSEEVRHTTLVVTFSPSGTRTHFQRSGGVAGAAAAGLLDADDVAREVMRAVERRQRHRLLGWKSRLLIAVLGVLPTTAKLALVRVLFARCR